MRGSGTELLIVSGEAVWPVAGDDVGVGRTAGLVAALAARLSVRVVAPVRAAPPAGLVVGVDDLPDEEPAPRLVAWASPHARRGRALLGPRRSRALLQAVADHRPRAILFVGGYLAAAAPTIDRPVFVDFPEVSVRRAPGEGRVAAVEALKARWWEPVEARRAVATSAASPEDVALLTSWGARAVLVPNVGGADVSAWAEAAAPLADTVEQVVRAPTTSPFE